MDAFPVTDVLNALEVACALGDGELFDDVQPATDSVATRMSTTIATNFFIIRFAFIDLKFKHVKLNFYA